MKKNIFSRRYLFAFFCTFPCFIHPLPASSLQPGDIAIIGFNFRDPDEFSFLVLSDISAGTVIYFTDCGWKAVQEFRRGEGLITYTVPSGGLLAGDVITFYSGHPDFTVAGVSGFFGLAMGGDQLFAFQGSFENPVFIFGINNKDNGWQEDAYDSNTSSLPPSLVPGLTAVALNQVTNGQYNCLHTDDDSKETLLQGISNPLNWSGSSDRITLPPACDFSALSLEIYYLYGVAKGNRCELRFAGPAGDIFIEKSIDGIDYYQIGEQAMGAIENMFVDEYFFQSSYFRIRSKDKEQGLTSYVVYVSKTGNIFSVFPNPYSGEPLMIILPENEDMIRLNIAAFDGATIASYTGVAEDIKDFLGKCIMEFVPGIYFLSISYSEGHFMTRWLKY